MIFSKNKLIFLLLLFLIIILFDNIIYSRSIDVFFCPKDNCAENIINELEKSDSEILIAAYSLTHDGVEKELVEKSKNVKVELLIEKQNINLLGTNISYLKNYFKVYEDKNKYQMHNKFFVIDEEIVITGSMNPTGNGDKRNNENLLIIKDKEIAKLYKQNFISLTKNNG